MERVIKFAVYLKGKLFGYEELRKDGWYSMCLELNPDNGERWSKMVMQGEGFVRKQLTGWESLDGTGLYEGDKCKGTRPHNSSPFEGEIIFDQEMCSFCLDIGSSYMPIPLMEFDTLILIK